MIRSYKETDIESVLKIWLITSKIAHDFIDPLFWDSQVENMRDVYIPASEVFVFEECSKVIGFYAMCEGHLAAIFVEQTHQGKGIGKQLIEHANKLNGKYTLSVYKENKAGYQFYLSQGFLVKTEQVDKHTGHLEYTMCVGT